MQWMEILECKTELEMVFYESTALIDFATCTYGINEETLNYLVQWLTGEEYQTAEDWMKSEREY